MKNSVSNQGDWLGLSDRVCVVTGAAGGIGTEIARQLLAEGARVALLDLDGAAVKQMQEQMGYMDTQLIAMQVDVTNADSVAHAALTVQSRWGGCDVLVNNAAVLYADAVMDIAVSKWNALLSVNLTGYLLVAQAFGKQMITKGGGSMVHIASVAGTIPQPWSGAYSVSKAAVKMLSQQMALELGEHRIRSNVVSPAMIRTPMSDGIYRDAAVLRQREAMVPAGRISTPADIAEAVLFLASDRASYISGQEMLVDGGLTQSLLGLIPRPGFEKQDAASQ